MPFTLEKLAQALRGIPRDAFMLMRLPDGTLRHIEMLRPVMVADSEGHPAVVRERRYAITFELSDGEASKSSCHTGVIAETALFGGWILPGISPVSSRLRAA